MRFRETLVPGPGVRAIPHLAAYLPECGQLRLSATPGPGVDSVAGWGIKPTSRYARQLAARRKLTYLALEDGFLRSVGLGEAGAPPLSLVVDDLGVYYDARRPSRLEALLQDDRNFTPALRERAGRALRRLVELGLSKTNAAPPLPSGHLGEKVRRRVLVMDQTFGDAAIEGGLADQSSFDRMLAAAIADEPDAEILVRRHPATAAGLKRGWLPQDLPSRVAPLDLPCSIGSLLAEVDAVYTVTSLAGFEALMRGLPVRCFGTPFYAGWGATRDDAPAPRRTARRSVEEIFAAAYILYARYVDPLTGLRCEIETAIERLAELRDRADLNAGFTAALGFAPWKHGAARTLLYSPYGATRFFETADRAVKAAESSGGRVVFWAGRETTAISATLARSAAPVLRMEDGFVRSRGLGSDFHRAASAVLDDLGVYYDATRPSRLEVLLEAGIQDRALVARAGRLREQLVAGGVTKYNLAAGPDPGHDWPSQRFRLLVVGQVENDKSIEKGCEDVRTNLDLLRAARLAHPDAFLVYKPHPDTETGNRPGDVSDREALGVADAVARGVGIEACLNATDGLACMTSLAGFEALLRGKPVWTFGRPFYAGWGLTKDALDFPRRTRRLQLDELVAGALILYPLYVHPELGLPCGPETVVKALAARPPAPAEGWRRMRYWRAIWEGLRRTPRARF
ncbi:MAG: capsular polysaccharide biosynthesis protein [Caulobacteraceae bacterium]|nr:capsular polysaccharide biosynthesis protein [Caulobacteraceae bacterium]